MEKETLDLAKQISELVADKKAEEVLIIDVGELCSYADALIICHGRSTRQAQTIASFAVAEMKKHGKNALGVEGDKEGHWILVDFGEIIVHVFYEPVRKFYDIEGIWPDAETISYDE